MWPPSARSYGDGMSEPLVLIADDDPRVREVLDAYLRGAGFRTELAQNGKRALELWRAASPDLLLLDLMMPETDGLEVVRRVRAESAVPVLMLTARADEIDRVLGLELGADDYIVKPFSPREVVARIRAVLRRTVGEVRSERLLSRGNLRLNPQTYEARCGQQVLPLTTTQFRVLAALLEHDRVYSREELRRGLDEWADERAVDVHIKNLRARLGECAAQLETVRGVGYRVKP